MIRENPASRGTEASAEVLVGHMSVLNMSCDRASTGRRCRFLDRCDDSLGVETSLKDICIIAAVLNSRCRSKFGSIFTCKFARSGHGSFSRQTRQA